MKTKHYLFGALAATMLFSSCQDDAALLGNVGEPAMVSFELNAPAMTTRAYSDGYTATVLQYAVYDEEGKILPELTVTDGEIHGSTTVKLQLTTGNTYSVAFWAVAEDAPYVVNFTNKTMTVDYNGALSNDENRDAFYKYHTFTVEGTQTETIELRRPFAQLNIGTNDYAASASAGYTPTQSSVIVRNIYGAMNFETGNVDKTTEREVEYKLADIKRDETFPVAGYEYLAMNYLLMDQNQELIEVEFTYTDGTDAKTRTVGSVPVQRNHRTNIYGQLLTSDVNINVIIIPEYDDPDHNIGQIADGVMLDSDGIYRIYNANGMKWLAVQVNDSNKTFEGKTVMLVDNIDFYNVDTKGNRTSATPIGEWNKGFKGTFDGQDYSINNLFIQTDMSKSVYGYFALFGCVDNATIKNLRIENAEVVNYGGYASIIAATSNGNCTFENINIESGILSAYNRGTAPIVSWAGNGTNTYKNINIGENVTVDGLWASWDCGLGGVVGDLRSGEGAIFENVTVACKLDAFNDVTASYKWYAYRYSGMLIGMVGETQKIGDTTYPNPEACGVVCTNVTVNYGDWMNYHYCEGYGQRNWARVESGYSYGGLEDGHTHKDGQQHNVCLPFNQLFGGGQGVYGLAEYDGVTVNYPFTYNQTEVTDAAGLKDAIAAGQNVKLASDVDCGTTQLALDNVKIDLNGKTLTTNMTYGGISMKNGASIKNGTIEHAATVAAIKAYNVGSIEDVTIKTTCTTPNKTITAIAIQQGGYVGTIKNVTIEGVSQGIEVGYQATVDVIDNVSVDMSTNGTAEGIGLVINGGKVGKAVNSTFTGDDYGVKMLLKGVFNVGLELVDCDVTGTTASISAYDEKGISNTSGSLTLTYDAATTLNGPFIWDFEDECLSVVTLNRP